MQELLIKLLWTGMFGVALSFGVPAARGDVRLEVEERRILLSETVQFEYGSARISARSFKILNELAKMLRKQTDIDVVRIEGHTDSLTGAAANMKLSAARANAVREYLVAKCIDEERLIARGYGQEWPIASNWQATGRQKNRRVDFVVVRLQGREVGRREVPTTYARVRAVSGGAAATGGDGVKRALAAGAAVLPGDAIAVDAGGAATVVFPKLHFVQVIGASEIEIDRASVWGLENPVRIHLKSGRVRVVLTGDSSRDLVVRIKADDTECFVERGDGRYMAEMIVARVDAGIEVRTNGGTAVCRGERSPARAVRFVADRATPFEPPAAPEPHLPAATGLQAGPIEFTWQVAKSAAAQKTTTLVEVARDTLFIAPVVSLETAGAKLKTTLPAGKFFWRVTTIDARGGWSRPSKTMSLTLSASTSAR